MNLLAAVAEKIEKHEKEVDEVEIELEGTDDAGLMGGKKLTSPDKAGCDNLDDH